MKKSSKNKKRKGLAHAISESTKRVSSQSGADQVSTLERAFVDPGMNELGEIPENITSVPNIPARESANQENIANTAGNTGNVNAQAGGSGRNRGRRAFFRQTGESDPYDMSIAPLNIYENQVIPIGIHNLSKSFRPNLSTIRVLSLGTKLIPKWKFEERSNIFVFFKDFLRRMQNKVYFTKTKTGVFEKTPQI